MKSQVDLLVSLLNSFSEEIGYNPCRDIVTIENRCLHEGEIAFLSANLPRLDDLLLGGLRDGFLPSYDGWKSKKGSQLPLLFIGFWERIFSDSGVLLQEPCIRSIKYLRQLCRLLKKEKTVCSEDYITGALRQFVSTDNELAAITSDTIPDALAEVCHLAFGDLIGEAMSSELNPKHGPGAVSERLSTNKRWSFETISQEVADLVGEDFFSPTWHQLLTSPPNIGTIPARLVAVPKTYTKPRLISIEPSYNQFLQQSLHTLLKSGMEKTAICSYEVQDLNKDLARKASITGDLATIDLSEASDRVSWELVKKMFGFNRSFIDYLSKTRSSHVQMIDGSLLKLNKFASMGSALTFPVEGMVFTTIVLYSICQMQGNWSRKFIRGLLYGSRDLRVYGDDIIVPTEYYPTVVHNLKAFGLKVNESKSFPSGDFKESCGGDYYLGTDVAPVYLRRSIPQSRRHVKELVSLSETRNQLVEKFGYLPAVDLIDQHIRKIIPYPAKSNNTPGIGRVGLGDEVRVGKTHAGRHVPQIRIMVQKDIPRKEKVIWANALNKCLRTGINEDPTHLQHDGRPVAARLNYRWVDLQ